jgi:hypothetical protein
MGKKIIKVNKKRKLTKKLKSDLQAFLQEFTIATAENVEYLAKDLLWSGFIGHENMSDKILLKTFEAAYNKINGKEPLRYFGSKKDWRGERIEFNEESQLEKDKHYKERAHVLFTEVMEDIILL